jgi:poly(3-hydroxybutyrate) depolymerase
MSPSSSPAAGPLAVLLLLAVPAAAWAEDIAPRECLVLPPVGRGGRFPLRTDPVEAALVAGAWTPPKAGDEVKRADGSVAKWSPLAADKDGVFSAQALAGGYAHVTVRVDAERVMILDAQGHSEVTVNGAEPRGGDPYSAGYVKLPVMLRKGDNSLLFRVGRGRLKVRLTEPKAKLYVEQADCLLPDLPVSGLTGFSAGIVVVNATASKRTARLQQDLGGRFSAEVDFPMLPLALRKRPETLLKVAASVPGVDDEIRVSIRERDETKQEPPSEGIPSPAWSATLKARTRAAEQPHRRTFLSSIDGSVQYYSVVPARPVGETPHKPGLVLSLHGASVEASGQAGSYAAKSWTHIVAPTNRRPFGFDWEDWGRLDAMEVLEHAAKELSHDPARVYLTGHSMGGHGTWHVGVTFPDRFAAIGSSAGWISMFSYAGAVRPDKADPLLELLLRPMTGSDTLALSRNTLAHGVYILHGDADDNVPVTEARTMHKHLSAFHRDLMIHEQPKAGHWWGDGDEPGAACVDWPAMFDFFARRVRPENAEVRRVEFRTANPGVSARFRWATVEQQVRPLKVSTVDIRCDPWKRRFTGTTDNVARLALDVSHLPGGEGGDLLAVELDGQKIEKVARPASVLRLARDAAGKWEVAEAAPRSHKGPHRAGPFKDAFRHRMVFVYGTAGTPEENAQSLAQARFWSETWWVRGNGSVDILSDAEFAKADTADRGVILFGNSDTNAAWKALMAGSPVQVRRGGATVGDRDFSGDDLACLVVRPRPGSDIACVAAVAGTGLPGQRLTERMPVFTSGVAYPDCLLVSAAMLTRPDPTGAVRAAGFFGNDWGFASGEWVWGR